MPRYIRYIAAYLRTSQGVAAYLRANQESGLVILPILQHASFNFVASQTLKMPQLSIGFLVTRVGHAYTHYLVDYVSKCMHIT